MTEYAGIRGTRVKYLSSDPTLNTSTEGQVWYNSTEGTLKSLVQIKAWSSGGNMASAKRFLAAAGTQTAGLAFGGNPVPTNPSEEYNGSGWSTGGNMISARTYLAGCGTQAAALAFGGNSAGPIDALTEEYDGSSWSEVGDLNTARAYLAGMGTQTAALAAGGRDGPSTLQDATEEYDGTSWTEQNNMSTARRMLAGAGTQTAGLVFGGGTPNSDATEEYDGTSWTAGGTMNTARRYLGGFGIQTSAIAIGGSNTAPATALTTVESYDGSTWTTSPASLATGRGGPAAAGNTTAGLAIGGFNPDFGTAISATEEYNSNINVITQGAWASGGALPGSGRQGYGVATGTQTATIAAGGPPTSTQNQFYDGSAWTDLASIPAGVTDSQGFGDSEELLMAGGNSAPPYSALTYVYSRPGNSWTAVASPGNINTARALGAGCGALSTAGIIAGGTALTTATESWNGSAWTTVNALPTATGNGVGSCGTQTAGLIWSGQNPGDPTAEETYEWDGTNWTSGGNRIIGVRAVRGGAGTQTAALTFGGWLDPGGSVSTEGYDGTSWSTRPNMAAAAANNFQSGTQTAALRAGGTDGPGYTVVEEFTGDTEVITASTLTTS
jgi:hypothetical protein